MPTTFELETLATYFVAEVRDLKSKLKEAEDAFRHVEKVANQSAGSIEGMFGKIGREALLLSASIIGVGGAIRTAFDSVKLAAESEQLEASFEVLLGSAKQAQKTLGELREFALATPFRLTDIVEAAKQMTAFGETADNLIPTMRMLGEVSSAFGDKLPLKELAYLYGTLKAQGRAFTIDIRQFAGRGIPIYTELAKVLGLVSASAKEVPGDVRQQLEKMIENGTVTFDVVKKAFENMTGPGGMFFGQLEKQSKTLIGLFNQMKEEIETAMKSIGATIIESLDLKTVVRNVSKFAQQVNEFLQKLTPQTKEAIKIVLVLTATFVALAAAIFVAGTAFNLLFGGVGLWIGLATTVIGLTTYWAMGVGGLEKAWDRLKEAAEDFWAFIKPVLPLLGAGILVAMGPVGLLASAVFLLAGYWDEVSDAVSTFWTEARPVLRALWDLVKVIGFDVRDWLANGFNRLVSAIKLTATQIDYFADNVAEWYSSLGVFGQGLVRTFGLILAPLNLVRKVLKSLFSITSTDMRDFLFFSEYVWKNFSEYVHLGTVWAMQEFETFKESLKHIFTSDLPALFQYFGDNWVAIVKFMMLVGFNFVKTFIKLLADGIVSIPDIISGKMTLEKLFDNLRGEVAKFTEDIAKKFEKIPAPTFKERESTQKEIELILEAGDTQQRLKEGFDAFRNIKLKEWWFKDALADMLDLGAAVAKGAEDAQGEVDKAGADLGNTFAKSFGKAAGKWDAALFGSAEAVSRLEEFRGGFPSDITAKQSVEIRPTTVVMNNPPPPNRAEESMVDLLTRILASSLEIEKKPPVVIGMPGLDG